MKYILTFMFFAGLFSHGARADAATPVYRARVLHIGIVQKVWAAKMDCAAETGEIFHHGRITSEWKELDSASAKVVTLDLKRRFAVVLSAPENQGDQFLSGVPTCFDPGYALRLQTDRGRVDLEICLRCGFLLVFDDKDEFGVMPDVNLLTVLKAAYFDEFILNEGIVQKP